jgi:hypothetical protein
MNKFNNINKYSIEFVKNACQADQIKLYFKLKMKFGLAERNIFFNTECVRLDVIPNYVNVKINSQSVSAKTTLEKAKMMWVSNEIKFWYQRRDVLSFYIFILHTQLVSKLHFCEWSFIDNKCRDDCFRMLQKKSSTQNKKLENLVRKQKGIQNKVKVPSIKKKVQSKVVNLSGIDFTRDEESLLGYGLKYSNPSNNIKKLKLLAANIDKCDEIRNDRSIFNNCADIIVEEMNKTKPNYGNQKDLKLKKSITEKVEQNNLIVTNSDKGSATVILRKDDYVEKVDDFIKTDEFKMLNKDPTKQFSVAIRKELNNCSYIFNEKEKHNLINMNPHAPRFFGLPKLHKQGIPIRPVVSFVNAPCSKVAHKMNTIFRQKTNFSPKYGIKNALDLVEKISNIPAPTSYKLVSFDIKNLFTNIPVQESVNIANEILFNKSDNILENEEIMKLITTCTSQNYFIFNEKFYEQISGLAMGSPLSPLLADIFMDRFEQNLFKNLPKNMNKIGYWFRYVDDIICLWTGTNRQLDVFFDYINKIHPKIKFTLEKEENLKINFLDLTISHESGVHEFSIFRKETYTGNIIPASSIHPQIHKHAAFHSFIERLINIPLNNGNYMKELSVIKDLAKTNGYSSRLIDNLIKKKERKYAMRRIYPLINQKEKDNRWITIPYLGTVSDNIGRKLKKAGFKIAYKNESMLRPLFSGCKDKIDKWSRSGVYKLSCADCEACYVGQTGRSFKVRINEHIRDWKKNKKDDSNFARHLIEESHHFDLDNNVEILHFESKGRLLNILEIMEIHKITKNTNSICLNDQLNNRELYISNLLK